jgi:lysophospholipase L1-like esterase
MREEWARVTAKCWGRMGRSGSLTPLSVAALVLGLTARAGVMAHAGPAAPSGPVSIMPLGDSITYGVTAPEASTPGGYRGYLADDLASAGLSWTYVGSSEENPPLGADPGRYHHEGHPGYRVDQVAADLDGPDPGAGGGYWLTGAGLRPPAGPEVVVLHIGTNDIAQAYDPAGRYPGGYDGADPAERAEFVDHLVARLQDLLEKLGRIDRGVRVVLCTIAPMGDASPDPTAHAYDDAIRFRVVPWERAHGVRIALADVEAAFMSGPGGYHEYVGPDGVHPTPLGYRTMADTVAPAVRAVLRQH